MAYKASSSNNAATTSVQVSTSGLSIADGDILIACVCAYRSTTSAPGVWWGYNYRSTVQSVSAPSGFTQVQQRNAAAAIGSCGGYLDNQSAGSTGNKDGSIANAVTTKHAFMFAVSVAPSFVSIDPMGMM